jgi:diacylglycerol kinase (ATP)
VRAALSLIVNPVAGGGRALVLLPAVTAELDRLGVTWQVTRSRSLPHARELAAAAAAAGDVVVAAGGDGMAGALAGEAAAGRVPFGIIPAGRGNDLARVLGIPAAPDAAARVLAAGRTRPVDLIGVRAPGQPEQLVAGSVYAGLPAVAGEIANATRWLRGPLVYPVAALRALARWQPVGFRLETVLCEPAAGGPGSRELVPGDPARFPGFAVVVANSAFFGAGMMVAPPAEFDDGVLDIVVMRHGPRLAFLRTLLKIRDGSHIGLAQISLSRATSVTLTMDRALPAAADGEPLCGATPLPAGAPLIIGVRPAALTALVPEPRVPEPAQNPLADYGDH